ncbi:hypothetical protein P154DRAFT_569046 [Amniculicola lignicola CBS 123094]|uniref:Uncharacterized protein n=1 Tax=Amniculicola lignicola CBS 123094 TaxID=1392246 RepID=A0A6A5X5U1_9PLEO|nr:hypothetical protein P154DRAFT_569046 [Amniculicola lignicola CBS 123094]
MDEPLDFGGKSMYTFDNFNNFDSNAMILDPCGINSAGPMMSDWNDPELDFSNFINNPWALIIDTLWTGIWWFL